MRRGIDSNTNKIKTILGRPDSIRPGPHRLFDTHKEATAPTKMPLPELCGRSHDCNTHQQQPPMIDLQLVNSPGNISLAKGKTNSESFLVAKGIISSVEGTIYFKLYQVFNMCYSISLSLNDPAALDAVTPVRGYFPYPQHAPKSTLFVPQSEYTNELNRIFTFTEKSFYFQKFFYMIILCVEIHFTTATVLPSIQSRWMQNSHPLHTRLSPYIDGQYSKFAKPCKVMSKVSFHEEAFFSLCEEFLQTIYQGALRRRNRFIMRFIQWSLLEQSRRKEREAEALKESFESPSTSKELHDNLLIYGINPVSITSIDDAEQEMKESLEKVDVDTTACCERSEEIRKEVKIEEMQATSKARVNMKRLEAAATIQTRKSAVNGNNLAKRVWRPSSSSTAAKPITKTPTAPPMPRDSTARRPAAAPSPFTARPQTGRPNQSYHESKEVGNSPLVSTDENDSPRLQNGRTGLDTKESNVYEDERFASKDTVISKSSSRGKGEESLSIFRDEIAIILSVFKEEIVLLKKELEVQRTRATTFSLPLSPSVHEIPPPLPKEKSDNLLSLNSIIETNNLEEPAMSSETTDNSSTEEEFPAVKTASETPLDNICGLESLTLLNNNSLPSSTRTSMLRDLQNNGSGRASASALLEQENQQLKSELESMQKKLESFEASLQKTQQMAQRIEEEKLQQLQEQWQQNTNQLLQSSTETARQQLLQEFQELFQAKEEEMKSLRGELLDNQLKMSRLESEKRKVADVGFNYASSSNLLLKFNVVEERLEKRVLAMNEAKSEEVKKNESEDIESPLAGVARYFLPCSDKFSEKRYMDLPKKPLVSVEAEEEKKENSSEKTITLPNPNISRKTTELREAKSMEERKQLKATEKVENVHVSNNVTDASKASSTTLPKQLPTATPSKAPSTKEPFLPREEQKSSLKASSPRVPEVQVYYDEDSPLGGVAMYFLDQRSEEEESPLAGVGKYFLSHVEVSRTSPSSSKLNLAPKSPQGSKPSDRARLNYPGRGNSGKLTI